MIIDLEKFVKKEERYWHELASLLDDLQQQGSCDDFEKLQRLLYLYERVSADYTKIANYSVNQELKDYLENLTASAYSFIHNNKKQRVKMQLSKWIFFEFPAVFRKNFLYVFISTLIFLMGTGFGGFALHTNKDAKKAILPAMFANHLNSPNERVKNEENAAPRYSATTNTDFAVSLMKNNIKVSILALALGITFGVGTVVVLFYNGVIFGVVLFDYINAGQAKFLSAWLLPHGIIEIPAILFAGATGLMIGHCMIKNKSSFKLFLREKRNEIGLFILAVVIMLIWAGIIEAFMSQVHEPIVTYESKIIFGLLEGILLICWLCISKKLTTKFKIRKTNDK